jgi:hypothetical protein
MKKSIKLLLISLFSSTIYAQADLPNDIENQIPENYSILSAEEGYLDDDDKLDYLIALKHDRENISLDNNHEIIAPNRPLLIFIQKQKGHFVLTKRNDYIVMKVNEGGQCDPFEDAEDGFSIENHYFTIQHRVACGHHWTDYITFRYSKKMNDWIFHKRIFEEYVLNPSNEPDADALILGVSSVVKGKTSAPVLFENYRLR